MKIDFANQSVAIGVGELISFGQKRETASFGAKSPRRMQIGQAWHRDFTHRYKLEHPSAEEEVGFRWVVNRHGWMVTVEGRIDLLCKKEEGVDVLEIKTVSHSLPMEGDDLRQSYPSYFQQLAIYAQGYDTESVRRAELVFLSVGDGSSQKVRLYDGEAESLCEELLSNLIAYLKQRRDRYVHRQQLSFRKAFADYREGQAYAKCELLKRLSVGGAVYFEAPTGFGKTGIALEVAFQLLKEEHCSRIIYLTSKNSGQIQVMEQINQMIDAQDPHAPEVYQMRNRRFQYSETEKKDELPAEVSLALRNDSLSFDQVQELARAHDVDGYFLSKLRLNYCDLWIGDYNYIFSEGAQPVFTERADFVARDTLLIIDEAHNLPERVRGAGIHRVSAAQISALLSAVAHGESRWSRILEEWERSLLTLTASQTLSEKEYTHWQDLAWTTMELAREKYPFAESLSEEGQEAWWSVLHLAENICEEDSNALLWAPENDLLEWSILSVREMIAAQVSTFKAVLFMSATLQPIEEFVHQTSTHVGNYSLVTAPAFWREGAYNVAVDVRVNTTLRKRAEGYALTTETIATLESYDDQPIVVFFSSFSYLKNIAHYLESAYGHITLAAQEAGWSADEQEAFLQEACLTARVILLVMGGSLSESIDLLGGKVKTAMVVGPPLAEKTALSEAIARASETEASDSFSRVYAVPAMRRLHQALGRLVRAPGQTARILLHDERFVRSPFSELLLSEYQYKHRIHTTQDLHRWLSLGNGLL